VFATRADAIRAIYARLDATVCEGCRVRQFTECDAALPDGRPRLATASASPASPKASG
jgi:hypothetical protein